MKSCPLFVPTCLYIAAMLGKDEKPVQGAAVLVTDMDDELSQGIDEIDVEKLGRQRPAAFSSTFKEVAFVICVLGSLSMAVGLLDICTHARHFIPPRPGYLRMLTLAIGIWPMKSSTDFLSL